MMTTTIARLGLIYLHKMLRFDRVHRTTQDLSGLESLKHPIRSEVINYLLQSLERDVFYLEVGVRNPDENFNRIIATRKISVDPGLEYTSNPVDYALTSDEFFAGLQSGSILNPDVRFDVIFIDGLHRAEQVDRDIKNSLSFIRDDGFVVLHDCNPPSEYHARENFGYNLSPAGVTWNGTTWKAFVKWRCDSSLFSCTVDTDWGLGILSKETPIGRHSELLNEFFEFSTFSCDRSEALGLVSFDDLKNRIGIVR
jgi:hypothetical protein